jgi:hypothetical protein
MMEGSEYEDLLNANEACESSNEAEHVAQPTLLADRNPRPLMKVNQAITLTILRDLL